MKLFFCVVAIGTCTFVTAQDIDSFLDTINSKPSIYGRVARLSQDNMPCMLPFNNTVAQMPNLKTDSSKNEMPNLWRKKYPLYIPREDILVARPTDSYKKRLK